MKEERKYREAVEDECEMEDDYAQDECYWESSMDMGDMM
jgi:hypothetical protein